MPGRAWTVLAATLILAAPVAADLVPDPSGSAPDRPVRPGARMTSPSRCTLNWVATDDAGDLYVGAAGHCVDQEGQAVTVAGMDEPFGEVWFRAGGSFGVDDFAWIRVADDHEDRVDPTTERIGGPTGTYRGGGMVDGVEAGRSLDPADPPGGLPATNNALPILWHGHGVRWGDDDETRTRGGVAYRVEDAGFAFVGPVTGGDSGAPVQIAGTGTAVGIVVGNAGTLAGGQPPEHVRDDLGIGPLDQQVNGPLLDHMLDATEEATGHDLDLVRGDPVDGS